jgi:hypothetical protein
MTRRWIVIDVLVVLLFVGIGRSNHHHGDSLSGMLSTTWPFAVGLAIGWLIVLVRRQNGISLVAGVEVWLATVALGMILRVIAGRRAPSRLSYNSVTTRHQSKMMPRCRLPRRSRSIPEA